jgi:hypothetical protein
VAIRRSDGRPLLEGNSPPRSASVGDPIAKKVEGFPGQAL